MGEGSGRESGRVRLLSAIAGRVVVSPGRVGSKKSDPWTTLFGVRQMRKNLSGSPKRTTVAT